MYSGVMLQHDTRELHQDHSVPRGRLHVSHSNVLQLISSDDSAFDYSPVLFIMYLFCLCALGELTQAD